MTVQQLINACLINKYILVRHEKDGLIGLNGKIAKLKFLKKGKPNQATWIQGFIPCSFNQYINYKTPFL